MPANHPIRRELRHAVLLCAGVASAGMGIKGFLLSSNFIDGGVTGISMLLAKITPLPLAVWLPLVNLPFVILGYWQVGRAFALRSAIAIAGLALVVAFVHYPEVTSDRVLTAVFGGFFLGAGIGLAVRGGGVLDGTEIGALLISKRSHLWKIGDVILGFNTVLFLAAMSVLGVEAALYSILTYITAARTLDFALHGLEEYTSLTIVADHSGEIRARITADLGRGVTVLRGTGGHTGLERQVLYCVVTRLEIGKVKAIIAALDPDAFVVTQSLSSVDGGVVRRPAMHGTARPPAPRSARKTQSAQEPASQD